MDKLDEIVSKGAFLYDEKQRPSIVLDDYTVGIRNDWKGDKTPYWVISSYKKDSIKGIDSNGAIAVKENYSLNNPFANPTTEQLKNQPSLKTITDFGTNYPEYYHDGKGAIQKLLKEKHGQVQGAFYKEGLGDIDLVWGNSKMGLAHILEKHPEVIEKIPEIIEKGKIDKGINRIFLNTDDARVAIALDYKGEDKKWIITAYEKDYPSSAYPHQEQLTPTTSAHRMQDNLGNSGIY